MTRLPLALVFCIACTTGHKTCLADDVEPVAIAWGDSIFAFIPPELREAGNPPVQIQSYGGNTVIARMADGSVFCWGSDASSYEAMLNVPGDVGQPNNPAVAVGQGTRMSVALAADGQIQLFGDGGTGSFLDDGVPSPNEADPWNFLVVSNYHGAVISESGQFASWGYQYLRPSYPNAGSIVDLRMRSQHSIALYEDGSVMSFTDSNFPNQPDFSGEPVKLVAAATNRLAVVLEDGRVRTWGPEDAGWTTPSFLSEPNDLVVAITGGGAYCLAFLSTGDLVAWGPAAIASTGGSFPLPFDQELPVHLSAGGEICFAIGVPLVEDRSTGNIYQSLEEGLDEAGIGSEIRCQPVMFEVESVDFPGESIDVVSRGVIDIPIGAQWKVNGGGLISSNGPMTIGGEIRVSVNNSISLDPNSEQEGDFDLRVLETGQILMETGASMQASLSRELEIEGRLVVRDAAGFAVSGSGIRFGSNSQALILGGLIQSPAVIVGGGTSDGSAGQMLCIDGTIAADLVRVSGGELDLVGGTIVGDISLDEESDGNGGRFNATGYLFGDLIIDSGRCTTLNDFFVVGDLLNGAEGVVAVQAGTMYVSGGIANEGQIYGEVVGAPGFMGGGQTSQGDGLAIAGDLTLGPDASIRFSEPLWRISLGGDFDVAITSPSQFELIGSTLRLDGSSGSMQHFEATSLDIGPDPLAFTDPPAGVSLIRELEIVSDSGVTVVDNHLNSGGKSKGLESIYTSRLEIAAGASLVLGTHTIYCTEFEIDGTVDHPDQIVLVSILPDPDFNNDGLVNGADLAFILAFWGTNDPDVDLNGDGMVTAADLGILLGAWGVYP